jgi:hypothetical protein
MTRQPPFALHSADFSLPAVRGTGGPAGPPAALVAAFRELRRPPAPGPQLAHDTAILWEVGDGTAVVNTGYYTILAECFVPVRLVAVTLQAHRESGSVAVDLLTYTPGHAPTYTSITNGAGLAISGGRWATAARADLEAAGWALTIPRGLGLVLSLDSVAGFTQLGATFAFSRLDLKDQRET